MIEKFNASTAPKETGSQVLNLVVKIKTSEARIFVDFQYSSNKTKIGMFKASYSNSIIKQSLLTQIRPNPLPVLVGLKTE